MERGCVSGAMRPAIQPPASGRTGTRMRGSAFAEEGKSSGAAHSRSRYRRFRRPWRHRPLQPGVPPGRRRFRQRRGRARRSPIRRRLRRGVPKRLRQLPPSAGKAAYLARVFGLTATRRSFDLLFCGHINMAALAGGLARWLRYPWWLQLHGIGACAPPGRLVRSAVAGRAGHRRQPSYARAVSRLGRRGPGQGPGPPQRSRPPLHARIEAPLHLLRRYGLERRRILLTVARLSLPGRYKGHDRVIHALPALRARFPDLVYVIAGDGDDRPRLEALAHTHGVADITRFIGQVAVAELVDHYRMADLFVMPSTGEGFGIVFLEAMACGVPAIGSDVDGSVDPLSGSALGLAVPSEQLTGSRSIYFVACLGASRRHGREASLAACRREEAPPAVRGRRRTAVRDRSELCARRHGFSARAAGRAVSGLRHRGGHVGRQALGR